MFAFAKLLPANLAEYARILVVALAVGLLCFNLGNCAGKRQARSEAAAARAEANVEAMKTDSGAKEQAAIERIKDATTVSENEKGLIDAIEDTPDTAPDAVRVKLGCERLRAAGANPAALPAVCRPGG